MRKRDWMLFVAIVLLAALPMGIMGCQNFSKNTYSSLYATGSVYNMGMKSVKMLQDNGIVSPELRGKINDKAKIFKVSYLSSVDAFKAWKQTESTELQGILQNLLFGLTQNFGEWQAVINSLAPGTIQGEIKLLPDSKVSATTVNNKGKKSLDKKKLDPTLVPIIVSVVGLIVQYGIPEMVALIDNLKKSTITLEDIEGLKLLVKDPETY